MRAAEIAELTRTTVYTVRHYHLLGLLPVPGERGGQRDYNLSHVARLSRIRWLVQAGVSLKTIRRILGGSEATGVEQPDDAPASGTIEARPAAGFVVEDLAEALAAVEDHLAEVARQRDMFAGLPERAKADSTVSPMSPRIAAFFDRLEQVAVDEATRCTVRKERDLTDLVCYRGQMPPEAEFLFVDPNPDYDTESLALYSQDPTEMSETQIEQRAQVMASRLGVQLPLERLATLANSVDIDVVRGLFGLIGATDYPDARLTWVSEREFLVAIDRWHPGQVSAAHAPDSLRADRIVPTAEASSVTDMSQRLPSSNNVVLKGIREEPSAENGAWVLVDRLWSRGVSKERAALDEWAKDATPTTELRRAFHSGDLPWPQSVETYRIELIERPEAAAAVKHLRRGALMGRVTLLFAGHDHVRCHVCVLREAVLGVEEDLT